MSYADLPARFGRSGARFVRVPGGVMKVDTRLGKEEERMAAQAGYLRDMRHVRLFPDLIASGRGWTVTEELRADRCAFGDYVREIQRLWTLPPRPDDARFLDGWPARCAAYAYRVAPGEVTDKIFTHLASTVEEGWVSAIHGDPTLDNQMSRAVLTDRGPVRLEPVFIDPLPPLPHVPPLRAVDLGKMLQSFVGWHEVEYAWDAHPALELKEEALARVFDCVPPAEMRQAVAFCAYHLVRAVPYCKEPDTILHLAHAVLKELDNAATRLDIAVLAALVHKCNPRRGS